MDKQSDYNSSNEQHNEQHKLKKEINFSMAFALVVGVVIGSGVFFKAGPVLNYTKSAGLGMAAWIIGGILTIMAGLTIAELSAAIPKIGGVFAYLDEIYGKLPAFLFGWMQSLVYVPAILGALAILFASQVDKIIPLGPGLKPVVAIGILLFLFVVNLVGTRYGGLFQLAATFVKLIPIFLIIIFGIIKGNISQYGPFMPQGVNAVSGFGAAILSCLWAYDGWVTVGNIASEMKNPVRHLPKVIVSGIGFVMLVYVLINYAYIRVLPIGQIISSQAPATDISNILFGNIGGSIISIGILISILGTLNGFVLTGVRMPFAMAEQRMLPFSKQLGRINERFKTPVNASIFIACVTSIYILSGSFDRLTDLAMFATWIFYIITLYGVFLLRRKGVHSPYRMPWYPVPPVIAIIGGCYIVISNIFNKPFDSMYAIFLTLVGIPIYLYLKKGIGQGETS